MFKNNKDKSKGVADGFVSKRRDGVAKTANRTGAKDAKTNKGVKRFRKSSDKSWANGTLKKSVLSGASPKSPLNIEVEGLSEKELKKARPKNNRKKALKFIGLFVLLGGLFYLWSFLNVSSKVFDGNPLGFLKSTKLKGEDSGRVNIMLVGTSEGDANHPGEDLTDSIMILSYTMETKKTAIISIPRDTWVRNKYAATKINALYHFGKKADFDEEGYFEGGIGLLQKELEDMTGLDIHYYAKINYIAFKEAVDAVGGIEVDIQGSDKRGIYDPNFDGEFGKDALKLSNGVQTLSGTQALLLARARNANGGYGLSSSDYARAENQRKMLIALKTKALGVDIFANPLKLNQLADAIGDNIKTNMKTSEARRIYDLAGAEGVQVESVGLTTENVLKDYRSEGTGAALIPVGGIGNYSGIREYISEKIGPLKNPTEGGQSGDAPTNLQSSSVVVLNAGGPVGAAGETSKGLPSMFSSLLVANASIQVKGNELVSLNTEKVANRDFLLSTLAAKENIDAGLLSTYKKLYPNADFVILVGS